MVSLDDVKVMDNSLKQFNAFMDLVSEQLDTLIIIKQIAQREEKYHLERLVELEYQKLYQTAVEGKQFFEDRIITQCTRHNN